MDGCINTTWNDWIFLELWEISIFSFVWNFMNPDIMNMPKIYLVTLIWHKGGSRQATRITQSAFIDRCRYVPAYKRLSKKCMKSLKLRLHTALEVYFQHSVYSRSRKQNAMSNPTMPLKRLSKEQNPPLYKIWAAGTVLTSARPFCSHLGTFGYRHATRLLHNVEVQNSSTIRRPFCERQMKNQSGLEPARARNGGCEC